MRVAIFSVFFAFFVFSFAQNQSVSPEQYARENPAPTFQLQNNEVVPADMLELAYKCLSNAAQAQGGNLIIFGFDMIDPRAYRLQGPRSLQTALRRAELNAKAQAVSFFNAVRVQARDVVNDQSQTSIQDSLSTLNGKESLVGNFSTQAVMTLSNIVESSVEGYLRGGRTTGTKVISLGEGGMCVGIRYEIPLDQQNFDPVGRATEESSAPPPAASPHGEGEREGFEAPPPGEIGNF